MSIEMPRVSCIDTSCWMQLDSPVDTSALTAVKKFKVDGIVWDPQAETMPEPSCIVDVNRVDLESCKSESSFECLLRDILSDTHQVAALKFKSYEAL